MNFKTFIEQQRREPKVGDVVMVYPNAARGGGKTGAFKDKVSDVSDPYFNTVAAPHYKDKHSVEDEGHTWDFVSRAERCPHGVSELNRCKQCD